MIFNIGDNIVSPLGWTTAENWSAALAECSGLRPYNGTFGLPEPFFASLIDEEKLNERFSKLPHYQIERYTKVEKMAILSAADAVQSAAIDPSAPEVIFVFSTTKGNVELLEDLRGYEPERPYLWRSAQLVARHFGNPNEPVVVSNACISGCAAQVAAARLLQRHGYRYAVVVGADVLSKFIISGFQSFKALSPERCKPFDANRCGLNLGEAAAAIVYGRCENPDTLPDGTIILEAGAICNDANHISGPSRTGEGLLRAIHTTTEGFDTKRIAFINAHGTATLYNDDMESVAINRAGLQDIPVNSLKGYYGHTLGAAGVMEVILSSIALQKHRILPSMGSENPGTANPLNVCLQHSSTNGDAFLKLISGFGGSNAALLFSLKQEKQVTGDRLQVTNDKKRGSNSWEQIAKYHLTPAFCKLSPNIDEQLTQQYRQIGINYPKFFKMDRLCKAGFLAAEVLLKDLIDDGKNNDDWGIILMNSASSLDNDRRFQQTIAEDNYFPSPAIFVYTLANIVTGEIAIRHKIGGETSFYVMPELDEELMTDLIAQSFNANPKLNHLLCGWVDVDHGQHEVRMFLCRKNVETSRREDEET
jgi:3-oxoacyl-(acyl-carrier-protein) synthase